MMNDDDIRRLNYEYEMWIIPGMVFGNLIFPLISHVGDDGE